MHLCVTVPRGRNANRLFSDIVMLFALGVSKDYYRVNVSKYHDNIEGLGFVGG